MTMSPGLVTPDEPEAPRYFTSGDSGPTAVNVSGVVSPGSLVIFTRKAGRLIFAILGNRPPTARQQHLRRDDFRLPFLLAWTRL